jgi:phytoene dehydrogenase-like protein
MTTTRDLLQAAESNGIQVAHGGRSYDAAIVGAGPNGLAAAITLARAGCSVLLLEARPTVGGGTRTAELTLPGFLHDVCSTAHPLGLASPFFRSLPLHKYGLEWIQPPAPLAHPFDDGTAAMLERSVEATSRTLGPDAAAYRLLMQPLARNCLAVMDDFLSPLHFPRHPIPFGLFGVPALWPSRLFARTFFRGEKARGLFAGMSAHSMLPLDTPGTAGAGFVLAITGHGVGWPVARGGSQKIADALACYLKALGGEIRTGAPVESIDDLPPARAVLFDVTPRQLLKIAGSRLSGNYRRRLAHYRYGPGVFKLDLAFDGPIPWRAAECARAGTVHVGGTLDEIAAGERAVWQGEIPERPFVLVEQASLFDPTRAPDGKQTVWAYCHVPSGSTVDMTERIEAQIERFAPGLRDRILARHAMSAERMQAYNANYIGGDINGGAQDLLQFYTRPAPRRDPYSTPAKGIYLCSSSTPPGGGVHGMCGYYAAQSALRDLR